ncbi:MAG TPA: hypothetical protein VHV47_01585, partial [Opitutaceae bacterium]|nr:hypothetical protein [Opitutaceae bacterium]
AAGPAAEALRHQIVNARVNVCVTGLFMVLVALVVLANARVWCLLLAGRRAPALREEPFVAAGAIQG